MDRLDRGVGRPSVGQSAVQEMESESALTDFTMGDRFTGVAWSLNPYVGCLHACSYCFVPKTMHLERRRWGRYVIVKQNLATVLRRELEEKRQLTVYVSTATDPYQPVEADRGITRSCLQLLARKDWPVDVLTRSPLVLRDIDVLLSFRRARVGLSVPTLDDAARRLVEPHAPPVRARLAALRTLARAGLTVYANYTPAYPPSERFPAPAIAETFADAGVQWVNTSPWRYPSAFLGSLWDRTHRTKWARLARFVGNPVRQASFRRALDAAFERAGVPLRTGFFNEPIWTGPAPAADQAGLDRFADANDGGAPARPCS